MNKNGGERGIRTRGTSSETPAMKAHLKKKWHQSGKSGKKRQIKHFPILKYRRIKLPYLSVCINS
jgi:hypothetical protein